MSILSQIRSAAHKRHSELPNRLPVLVRFIGSMKEIQLELIDGIAAEEDRTRLHHKGDVGYSLLAKSMQSRLRNIELSIERLEVELTRLHPQLEPLFTKLPPDHLPDAVGSDSMKYLRPSMPEAAEYRDERNPANTV